jgi:copper chaperone CopZ
MTDTARPETLAIEGMTCGHCVASVERALGAVPGVTVLSVEIGRAEADVAAGTDRAALVAAVEDAGFDVVA